MILEIAEKDLKMVFEVSEDRKLYLLHCANFPYTFHISEERKKYYPAIELHISGEGQNDHHGAKHTMTSGCCHLQYITHHQYENGKGTKLEFVLSNDLLKVVLHYQFYHAISVVRAWTVVENISDKKVGLEYVSSFTLTGIDHKTDTTDDDMDVYIPHNSWVREVVWRKNTLSELGFDRISRFSTKRINVFNTGTWSTKEYLPMGAVENRGAKVSLLWQIENNGSWQWEISDIDDRLYLKLSGPNENETHWYKELNPGQTFESVKAAVAIGDSFESALEEMTKYRRAIVRENRADVHLPVIFNDYMDLWADPTAEKMMPIIDKAAEAGAEYYCMDAGWYADGSWWDTVGEWQPCTWRFPNGIKAVFDYIRKKGMIPGIWLEIEVMGIKCPILSEFTDDCFFVRHGKRVIDHGRYQLDFRNEKVRAFASSVIDRVVNEYGIGYIKLDYNIEGGLGTEIDADSFGDGLLMHNRAYLAWIEDVMDKYPHLIIENCSSGGMRMDYAMLALHSIQSVSDQEDYRDTAIIAANCATAVLPEQGAIWSYPKAAGGILEAEFNMVNSMLCRMYLSGEICNLSDEQFRAVKDGIKCYKALRDKIRTFIPFYPLGLNMNTKPWACVGYKANTEVYLAVWRLDAESEYINIPIECNTVEIVYPLKANIEITNFTREISVKFPNQYQGVILRCL